MQTTRRVRFVPLALALAFAVLVGLAWVKNQAIYDWWRLRAYVPSAAIAQLATDTTMNESTRRLFYVYHPELQDKAAFNQSCTDSEKTIVLGCYVSRTGIYLYDVTDERLHGLEQVTAAHETLHAAYERLSSSERKHIDTLTAQTYGAISDKRIKDTVEAYRQKDPSVVPNELHSILGSEVPNLPSELETYYKRYFTDRAAVVRLSQQYQQEFTSRQDKVDAADKRLGELRPQIEQLEASVKQQSENINTEYERLQSLKRNGQVDAYNAGVTSYNRKVSAYNADVRRLQAMIRDYNALVAERNALAVEENDLYRAMDSRSTTIETQ